VASTLALAPDIWASSTQVCQFCFQSSASLAMACTPASHRGSTNEVGVSLRNATAKVSKVSRSSAGNGGRGQGDADPWASAPASGYSDEPPF
jgi:hypothetical protein